MVVAKMPSLVQYHHFRLTRLLTRKQPPVYIIPLQIANIAVWMMTAIEGDASFSLGFIITGLKDTQMARIVAKLISDHYRVQ